MKTLTPSSAEWASEQLKLQKLPDESSLLKYIEGENFLVNDLEAEALDILSGRESGANENYQNFCTAQLLKEISSFRKEFFSISIQERRERLKKLEEAAENSLSSKAALHELRLAVFIDLSLIPEGNKAVSFIERIITSSAQNRSTVLDEADRKSDEEKKEIYKDYQDLEKFDSDLLRLCPQLENILNPKVVEEVRQKPRRKGKSGIILLVLIIIYLLYKIISLGMERDAEQKAPAKPEKKEEAVDKKEVDKFLEYMENKDKKSEKNPEKNNE